MQRLTLLALVSSGLMIGGIGCSGSSSEYKKTTELKKAPAVHDHSHSEKGPHGGSLVELGEEEYHAEVVLDHDSHALRVFVLGKDAKTATATSANEITLTPDGKDALTLKAAPQKGDPEGKASLFELIDGDVVHAFLDAKAIHAKLRVTIADKKFLGEVDYHLDGIHHDHKDEMKDEKHGDHAPKDGDHAPKDGVKPEETKDGPADKDKK